MTDIILDLGDQFSGIKVTITPGGIVIAGHVERYDTGTHFISWGELLEAREQVWANLDVEVEQVRQLRATYEEED